MHWETKNFGLQPQRSPPWCPAILHVLRQPHIFNFLSLIFSNLPYCLLPEVPNFAKLDNSHFKIPLPIWAKVLSFFFNLDFSFSSENEHFKICLLAVCELFSHVLCHFPTRLYLVIFWYFLYIKSIICHLYYKSFLHVIMYHLILLVVISDTSLLMFT